MSIACTGCSNGSEGGDGGGGSGGTDGPQTAFSFDEESAEQAASATAAAVDLNTKFGGVMSNLLSALASGVTASPVGVGPKAQIPIPPICAQGEATLNWEGSGVSQQPPFLTEGDVVTLTLVDCAGSPVSTGEANGTIVLTIRSASGGLPYIGGIIQATAELALTIAPDISLSGSFAVDANLPNLFLANLTFGARSADDRIVFTKGSLLTVLACFEVYQRVGLAGPGIEFFRPLGVLSFEGQVFTLNDYASTPPNISFEFAGFDATPVGGSLTLTSGDRSGGVCDSFSGGATGNGSNVEATFTGGGCVTLEGTDTEGEDFSLVRLWDSLLDVGRPGEDPGEECDTRPPITDGTPGPETCDPGNDIFPIADTFINGSGFGEDPMLAGMNFGDSTSLLIKSVPSLGYTRKIYIRFDLGDAPETFDKASLVLTVDRHIGLGPQPVNVFGITTPPNWDRSTPPRQPDWDPEVLPEDVINWDNAPRNVDTWVAGMQFDRSDGQVPLLIPGYDFDLGLGADQDPPQDPPGTKYALDITEYVRSRQMDGADGMTILMAVYNPMGVNEDASVFFSKEVGDEQECDRPFLRFEIGG